MLQPTAASRRRLSFGVKARIPVNTGQAGRLRLFFGSNNIRRFKTLVAMGRVKVGLTVSIEQAKISSSK